MWKYGRAVCVCVCVCACLPNQAGQCGQVSVRRLTAGLHGAHLLSQPLSAERRLRLTREPRPPPLHTHTHTHTHSPAHVPFRSPHTAVKAEESSLCNDSSSSDDDGNRKHRTLRWSIATRQRPCFSFDAHEKSGYEEYVVEKMSRVRTDYQRGVYFKQRLESSKGWTSGRVTTTTTRRLSVIVTCAHCAESSFEDNRCLFLFNLHLLLMSLVSTVCSPGRRFTFCRARLHHAHVVESRDLAVSPRGESFTATQQQPQTVADEYSCAAPLGARCRQAAGTGGHIEINVVVVFSLHYLLNSIFCRHPSSAARETELWVVLTRHVETKWHAAGDDQQQTYWKLILRMR